MSWTRKLTIPATAALLAGFGLTVPTPPAEAAPVTGFDPAMIITDALFYDSNAMTAAQVQSFLNKMVPTCEPWRDANPADITCLKDYVTKTVAKPANSLCKGYTVKTQTAAQIIDGVARACGISQKVLLVTLQKEQRLVTHTWPSSFRYRKAMGYACPDTAPCDAQYYGFFNQLYSAAYQFKRYQAYPNNYGYRAGRLNNIRYHPNASCGTKAVTIKNQATAGLYIYTPYTPNAASLAAGTGSGDACSSYGNRNFYIFYTDWFGPTTGLTVHSSLKSAYSDQGGSSVLGKPTDAGRYLSADGGGWMQTFTKGTLFRTKSNIVTFLPKDSAITTTYLKAGGPSGSWGWPLTNITCKTTCTAEFRNRNTALKGTKIVGNPYLDISSNKNSNNYTSLATPIRWMATEGIGDRIGSTYNPRGTVTRADLARFLYKYTGSTYDAGTTQTFTDVAAGSTFHDSVEWMNATGISRTTKATFGATDTLTQASVAVYLYRLAAPRNYTPPTTSPFTDVTPTTRFYKEMAWAYETGIDTGSTTTNGRAFNPNRHITRDVLALRLKRFDSKAVALVVGDPLVEAARVQGKNYSLGLPVSATTSVAADGGGWMQTFTKGTLFRTKSNIVTFLPKDSAITTTYLKAGGPSGSWGWPLTNITCKTTCTAEFRNRNTALKGTKIVGNPYLDISSNKNSNNYTSLATPIRWMATEGIGDRIGSTYNPRGTVTRADLARFLYKYTGSTYDAGTTQTFTDVAAGSTFHDSVEWMNATGISRTTKATFGATDTLTQASVAVYLYRLAAPRNYTPPTTSPFTDVTPTTRFYKEMAWAYETGIDTGSTTTNGRAFNPNRHITRDVLALRLNRMERRGLGR